MNTTPRLIVMLTDHDRTVENAAEVFEQCKDTDAQIFGCKASTLPPEELRALFAYMRACGKETALEVVAYDEETCLQGARMALSCGCDYLMGTKFFDSVNELCRENGLRYLPFVGQVEGVPSVLSGSPEAILAEAKRCLEQGVFGIDLLGYRYTGDAFALNKLLVSQLPCPVCIAGSIDSYERLDEIRALSPWAFTIGGAFFDHHFGTDIPTQINNVCRYLEKVPC